MARAISSLPVPVSPLISTEVSVGATRRTLSSTAVRAGLRPDDFLEVARRLDLFLQVQVLLLQARSLPLRQDAVGDIDDHRPRVLAVRLGTRPELHPYRPAVVLAAKLQLDKAAFLAVADVLKGRSKLLLIIRGRGHQRHADRAGYVFGAQAQQFRLRRGWR